MRLPVLISVLVLANVSFGGWDLTTSEERDLLAQTIHCQFVGRLRLTTDCFSDIDEEYGRFVFMALKDENGRAVFPYRIRLERGEIAKEAFCYIADELDWKSKALSIISERNLILENCVTNSFDRSNPSMATALVVGETNGVTYIEVVPPCSLLGGKVLTVAEVPGNDVLEHLPYFGDVVRQQWADLDDELILGRHMSELMRAADVKKRICAWAIYSAGGRWDTRHCVGDAAKRKKKIKIRVWNEGVEMNRENALCVASIDLECSENGLLFKDIDVERGAESLTVKCGEGVHGAGVRIVFDGSELLIFP